MAPIFLGKQEDRCLSDVYRVHCDLNNHIKYVLIGNCPVKGQLTCLDVIMYGLFFDAPVDDMTRCPR